MDSALLESPGSAASTRASPEKGSLKTQLLLYPQNYLTESDWKILEDVSSSREAKLKALAARLRSLGCRSLAEKTAGACVALACALLPHLPPFRALPGRAWRLPERHLVAARKRLRCWRRPSRRPASVYARMGAATSL